MATIFLSHASRDDDLARQVEDWLAVNGFDDLFADHSDIRGGDKWTEALRRAKGSCRVVLCLVTPNWLASDECFGEFTAAWYAGKRIIPLLALGSHDLDARQKKRLNRSLGEDQGFDLTRSLANGKLDLDNHPDIADPLKAGLRAGGALAKIGLDPEAFEIDRDVLPSPFPGLQSFDDRDADAAVFYGRSPDIARCLEDLREMRANGDNEPYAILGASGSGKSSLLKAGVLPRLRRERGWIVLRSLRPGADPLFNFAEAITRTFEALGDSRAPGVVRDDLRTTWQNADKQEGFATDAGLQDLRQTLDRDLFAPLRAHTSRPNATILIALDQAEELARTDEEGADTLCDYLRAALLPRAENAGNEMGPVVDAMVVLTTRSDSFPELQAARRFAGLNTRGADIRTVRLHRLNNIIEEPAGRYGVQVDPELADAIFDDAPSDDALPLVAFALQRLWDQFHQTGHIRKNNYGSVGGLDGLINEAAERALQGIYPDDHKRAHDRDPPKRREKIAVQTFIPGLAQINEYGRPIRRVASWERIGEEGRDILKPFEHWRLITAKRSTNPGTTVEISHEAIFRVWKRFHRWLEPEKERLEALHNLKISAATWNNNGRKRSYIDHRGRRLALAKRLRKHDQFQTQIEPVDEDYLSAATRAQSIRLMAQGTGLALAFGALLASAWTIWKGTTISVAMGVAFVNLGLAEWIAPEMKELDGGTFMRGSPTTEKDRQGDEGPQREVSVPSFAIGIYEITVNDWEICLFSGGCRDYRPASDHTGYGRGWAPVNPVSWEDAQAYTEWLSEVTGDKYRLPTEAEWEYAARAGTTTRYHFGDEMTPDDANYWGSGPDMTTSVGSYPPNEWGLHDMHGNVWEWVQDSYAESYKRAPIDGTAYDAGTDSSRVLRGGSWSSSPEYLRSADRFRDYPVGRLNINGFRVARTLTP